MRISKRDEPIVSHNVEITHTLTKEDYDRYCGLYKLFYRIFRMAIYTDDRVSEKFIHSESNILAADLSLIV